jgi:hypothetical protein
MVMKDDVEALKRGNLGVFKLMPYQVSYDILAVTSMKMAAKAIFVGLVISAFFC